MPIFEYACRHCEHCFDEMVLSAREKVVCSKCSSGAVKKGCQSLARQVQEKQRAGPALDAVARRKPAAAARPVDS